MELHKDSGALRVIIDVSYTSIDEFIDFIENEQCQFIESLGVDGLNKFEWYVNEETNTATLIEEFDNASKKTAPGSKGLAFLNLLIVILSIIAPETILSSKELVNTKLPIKVLVAPKAIKTIEKPIVKSTVGIIFTRLLSNSSFKVLPET